MPNMRNKKGIVLLSSGLDSLVSLHVAQKQVDIVLALTFNYGQKAAKDEIEAARLISEKYNIKHKVIDLPFLKEETKNALSDDNISLEFEKLDENSAFFEYCRYLFGNPKCRFYYFRRK